MSKLKQQRGAGRRSGSQEKSARLNDELIIPSVIHLYKGTGTLGISMQELALFLQEYFPISVINMRQDYFHYWIERVDRIEKRIAKVATRLAQSQVSQSERRRLKPAPLTQEVSTERQYLVSKTPRPVGTLYDGYNLIALCSELLPSDEVRLDCCHIIVTDQLLGTWQGALRRYNACPAVFGFPSFISLSAAMEGLARSKEQSNPNSDCIIQTDVEKMMEKRDIRHGGASLQEIIKGYALQILFYHITGDPFCEDRKCMLFSDQHHQDLMCAQLRPDARLCDLHSEMLEKARYV